MTENRPNPKILGPTQHYSEPNFVYQNWTTNLTKPSTPRSKIPNFEPTNNWVLLNTSSRTHTLGWSILPKVQKLIVSVDFPIHLDPRTSTNAKISIFFQIYLGKQVEVLLYDLYYSGFGPITWAQKNHEGVGLTTPFFLEELLGLPGLPKKILGSGGPTYKEGRDPPCAI